MALGFGVGAVARVTFEGDVSAASEPTVQPGDADAGREQILSILADRYFERIDDGAMATTSMASLATALDDQYTHFMTTDEYQHYMSEETADAIGIGVDVVRDPNGLRITRVFPGSPAARGWLSGGDVITAVDGHPLAGLDVRAGLAILRGAADTTAALTIKRNGVGLVATVTRLASREWMVDAEMRSIGAHQIGYVALLDFSEGAADLVNDAVRRLAGMGADAFVLDLRGNPGGWAKEAVGVASVFLPEDSPVLIERSVHFDDTTYTTHVEPVDTVTPLAVLVDHDSASSAEIVAGALRDDGRATLVGATTYGKGRIQDVVVLDTGGALKFTIAEYLTPSGFALDRVGLDPDVSAPSSPVAGADPAFAAAVSRLTS